MDSWKMIYRTSVTPWIDGVSPATRLGYRIQALKQAACCLGIGSRTRRRAGDSLSHNMLASKTTDWLLQDKRGVQRHQQEVRYTQHAVNPYIHHRRSVQDPLKKPYESYFMPPQEQELIHPMKSPGRGDNYVHPFQYIQALHWNLASK